MAWVSVEDGLPEKEARYLVIGKDRKVYLGHWQFPKKSDKKYAFWWTKHWFPFSVTHWMPLPDLPEE